MLNFILRIFTYSITMSLLALLFQLVNRIVKDKISAKARYFALLILVIGFAIPVRPTVDLNLFSFTARPSNELPQSVQRNNPTATKAQAPNKQKSTTVSPLATSPIIQLDQTVNTSLKNSLYRKPNADLLLFIVYLIGAVVTLLYHIRCNYLFSSAIKRWGYQYSDKRIRRMVKKLQTQLGIKKNIRILRCPVSVVSSPMLKGVLRPTILLPDAPLSDQELALVLKHELVHLKQGDIFFKGFMLLAICINWFNPVIYFLSKSVAAHCELACDETVLKGVEIDRRKMYGRTMVLFSAKPTNQFRALTTNFYGGKNDMDKRIASLLDTRKRRKGTILLAAILLVTVIVGCRHTSVVLPQKLTPEANVDMKGRVIKIVDIVSSGRLDDVYAKNAPKANFNYKLQMQRYLDVEKKYNCKFEYVKWDVNTDKKIKNGTLKVDFYPQFGTQYFYQIANGNNIYLSLDSYKDILDLDNADIWNVPVMQSYSLGKAMQVVSPRIDMYYRMDTPVLLFNETMLKKSGLAKQFDLYAMQKEKTWNWVAFEKVCKAITKDTDKDGKIDRFAFSYRGNMLDTLALCDGKGNEKYTKYSFTDAGDLKLIYDAAAQITALNLLLSLNEAGCIKHYEAGGDTEQYQEPYKSFVEGKTLFYFGFSSELAERNVETAYNMPSMKYDVGAVTIPFGPDNTNGDYRAISRSYHTIGIVKGAKDPAMLCKVLKDICVPLLPGDEYENQLYQMYRDNGANEAAINTIKMLDHSFLYTEFPMFDVSDEGALDQLLRGVIDKGDFLNNAVTNNINAQQRILNQANWSLNAQQ